ncbi:DNA translocase FtsK [Candidatus Villigracilis affinis]|jgi:S-DNA-T family DNA segregation ATPase FtsK/SpoIIIE|uniref:FtsK/SpoIIIE family DNA translocase n=1 Tax=Candidatus Villigracilis affinis TaxID=3140682 RepID=UPI002A1A317A|nr:DNA translocase FtsK [Anaerolineales bacterium]
MSDSPHPRNRQYQQAEPPPIAQNDWFERLARFYMQFGRFLRDVFGVLFVAFAFILLLGVWKFTDGVLVTPIAMLLKLWFGWGSLLVIFALGYFGYSLVRRNNAEIRWGQIISLELASLLTLGLLAVFWGNDITRAESGWDGGRLGWGLVTLVWRTMGEIGGTLVLFLLWLFTVVTGFGLWTKIEAWLLKLAGEAPPVVVATPVPAEVEQRQIEQSIQPAASASRKKANPLPAEFRTTLKQSDKKDEKPAKARPRDEDLPPLQILLAESAVRADERTINQTAGLIMKTLADFGIPATVIGYRVGPSVTQFAVQPGFIKKPGSDEEDVQQMKVRVAQIASLEKDIALALSAQRLRIEAPVPGKPYVGIEVPNTHSSVVRLKTLLESEAFNKVGAPLTVAIGRDVSGHPLIADLSRMPHLLIAGATGSGKSVCITSIAACLAMNNSPEDLRMVMIDSKMVELIRFNGLPHLYGKVETNLERILGVLRWVVVEMEHRYRLLESAHARDLDSYNRKVTRKADGKALPRIVVMIDELADLMMSAPDVTEHNLVRLAQMARATGIHLVVATQRPSTDVVTGLIKANFPARLAFAVASGIDSRVILDYTGAESLLGRGDMLFLNPEVGNPVRAQGVMITDMEIERIISHWQKNSDGTEDTPPWEKLLQEPGEGEDDGLVEQAISIVRQSQRASASLLQRRLRVGYPRAARLLDQLEEMGVVGPSQGGGKEREVLVSEDDLDADKQEDLG